MNLEGKFEEAETVARACLAMRPKYYNADDWHMPDTRVAIGQSLVGQKRYAEAEPLLVSAYDAIPAANPGVKTTTARALTQLYESMNHAEKAAEWTRKAAETAVALPAAAAPATPQPAATPNP